MIGEQRAGLSLVTQLVTRSEAEDPAALQVFQRFSRRALASLTENEDALDQGPHGLLKVHSFATSPEPMSRILRLCVTEDRPLLFSDIPQNPCHGSCTCVLRLAPPLLTRTAIPVITSVANETFTDLKVLTPM